MKKILPILLLTGGVTTSSVAQQLPNADFEGSWNTCTPYLSGDDVNEVGTTPESWCISNVAGYKLGLWFGATEVGQQITGRNSKGSAVQVTNTKNTADSRKIVPGYFTLGTTWNTASTGGDYADGGTFGGISFGYKPDAIRFYYKRSYTGTNTQSSFIAYLWSGSTSQADVPANIAAVREGTYISYDNRKKITMTNRDVNILGKTYSQGGTVTNNSKLIASIEEYTTETADDWMEKTIEFTYNEDNKNETPEMFNVIFAASDYFNSDVTSGVSLSIDDVTLIYYNTLSTLTYDGTAIELEDGKTSYDLSAYEYDASLLSYTLKGVGAYATSSYDETTGVLTLTVMGNDYKASVNDPDTYTVYTIQFGYTVEKTYSNTLMVDVSGQRTAPSEDNITLISVYENSENSYSLQLKNFSFNGWLIGDILVTDLTRTENEDGSINYAATDQLVKLDGMGGISLPVTVDANVVDDELTATITISDAGVVVTFAPSITISSDADVNVEAGLKNVTFNRDFNAGWSTLCLPFDYSVTDLGATYAQEFSDADENGLDFSQVSTMEANKPYLVYFSDAVTSTPIYFGVEVKEPSPIVVDKNGYTFQGNYKYNFSMAGLYGVVNTDSDQYQYIRRGGTNSTLNATGAYFTLPSTSSAQSMVLNLSGEITSIDSVVTDGSANGPVYNLQGIRVSNSSLDNLPKGIYMQNGKKIYVK